jgi:hypothetical protein
MNSKRYFHRVMCDVKIYLVLAVEPQRDVFTYKGKFSLVQQRVIYNRDSSMRLFLSKEFRKSSGLAPFLRLVRFFLALGHCGEYDYALWATAPNFFPRFEFCRAKIPGKICKNFCTMGHCSEFGCALWA